MTPRDKWNVEYKDLGCRLSRSFAAEGRGATLVFDMPLLRPMDIGLSGLRIVVSPRPVTLQKGAVEVILEPAQVHMAGSFASAALPKNEEWLIQSFIEGMNPKTLGDSRRLDFHFDNGSYLAFDMTGASRAFAALEACRRDLAAGWGLDPDEHLRVSVPAQAIGDETSFITPSDFPPGYLGSSGTTQIHWTIDTSGRSVDCVVDSSSGNRVLDAAACRAITSRGRYRPALGTDGKPISSHKSRAVTWKSR
jgi:TonB family protein